MSEHTWVRPRSGGKVHLVYGGGGFSGMTTCGLRSHRLVKVPAGETRPAANACEKCFPPPR